MTPFRTAFLGAGGIARAHAYALDVLKYYYPDSPKVNKCIVASPTPESRSSFAKLFDFAEAIPPEEIWSRQDIDTLYILGPNHTHTPQLLKAAEHPTIQRIYVEKPVGVSKEDIQALERLDDQSHQKRIMMGFQFLQKSALRNALHHWHSGEFGEPIHFRAAYLHSGYLDSAYREKRQARLKPTPIGGAAADLGSHALSLLTAFLGHELKIISAAASGRFPDVPEDSDLCTTAMIKEKNSGAVGSMIASRVSAGSGDLLTLEIRATRGALLFDSAHPDVYETFLPKSGWQRHEVMSDYLPTSKFPSDYLPSGWLRALVHAHYLFLGGEDEISMFPDLAHGIAVQRLLQAIAGEVLPA